MVAALEREWLRSGAALTQHGWAARGAADNGQAWRAALVCPSMAAASLCSFDAILSAQADCEGGPAAGEGTSPAAAGQGLLRRCVSISALADRASQVGSLRPSGPA